MKQIINDPFKVADEMTQGLVLANSRTMHKLDCGNVVVKNDIPKVRKANILTGGGSGHEPLFGGFVGKGMADCAVSGNIFASPTVDMVYEGIKACNTGDGVIMIYGNYQGDIINFGMAKDMAMMDGIRVEEIQVNDDVASGDINNKGNRRGTGADLTVIKIASAASDEGLEFDEVLRLANKANDNSRSFGVSLSSCTVPGRGKVIFELGEDEIFLGMGLHGEPGVEKRKMCSAKEFAKIVFDKIYEDDLDLKNGDEVVIMVNGYGSTTQLEQLILVNEYHKLFEEKGIKVHYTAYGNLCTSLEMAGTSLTVMKLDDELKALWDKDAVSPGFTLIK